MQRVLMAKLIDSLDCNRPGADGGDWPLSAVASGITRPAVASTAAGLLSETPQASGYVPLSRNPGLSFVALRYALGSAVVTMLGVLLGASVLR